MRILMIIDGLPGGGAEKVVLTLCEGMQQMGHQVSLFSLRNVCHYALPDGIDYQVVESHSRTPWRKLTELSRRAAALEQAIIASEQQSGDFDLIFSHLHKTDRIVARCKTLPVEKLWFCIHGILSTSYLGHRRGLDRWLKQRKIGHVYQGKNIVAVSQAVADDLTQNLPVSPRRLAVINNPFDINAILSQAAEPFTLPDEPYLIHVGRFHPHKRHDRLLRAYAKSGIQARLLLVGTGDQHYIAGIRQLAEKLGIADRVIFAGFQANPYPLIKHAAMLVLSSDSEGFGNVLVEALLCGTPVVSTRCPGGPAEILQRAGMSNVLADLKNQSLAEKMAQVWQSPPAIDHQQLMSYDLQPICQQYLSLKD
ncbi:glycosyltransferase involved in cell wall biosynthesis [Erwinia toletana]|uniref:Glycosyltransferase involved in cell wall biosynthesis n=1 Tax=Winslowiella toletana TaxID=92490 RepID=A0ABS4P8Z9_9GAMM|nr:glycosyltransferase [Winslowiella toletana]MBP2169113.1 glycosyltransferase involved in cell wall biosynthesis [Winslowiella toletana]